MRKKLKAYRRVDPSLCVEAFDKKYRWAPTFSDAAVRDVRMDLKVKEAEDRVWKFFRNYLEVQQKGGFSDLPKTKLDVAIGHIVKPIQPLKLKSHFKNIPRIEKEPDSDRKSFDLFMKMLARKEKKFESDFVLHRCISANYVTLESKRECKPKKSRDEGGGGSARCRHGKFPEEDGRGKDGGHSKRKPHSFYMEVHGKPFSLTTALSRGPKIKCSRMSNDLTIKKGMGLQETEVKAVKPNKNVKTDFIGRAALQESSRRPRVTV